MREKKSLVGFKTFKWVCHRCKKHFKTLPIMQGLDMDEGCECGCTSFVMKKGRNLGKKHRDWDFWLDLYNGIKDITPKEFLGAIYKRIKGGEMKYKETEVSVSTNEDNTISLDFIQKNKDNGTYVFEASTALMLGKMLIEKSGKVLKDYWDSNKGQVKL